MTPICFDNSYARLPARFFERVAPEAAPAPALIRVNERLAADLGIEAAWLGSAAGLDVLSGRAIAPGSEPIALAYAGHQFGGFVPQLGDGRAVLLGEVIDAEGRRRDIQLKGSGRTPFSRMGDGRAALGPVLREYLVSEAMAALGIPTTRTLAAVTTGDHVFRETVLPGAILTRVASSHVRVGTFQYFAARHDVEALRLLADHVISRHYPQAAGTEHPYRSLFDAVVTAQAELVAQWMLVGFIHGVMNTDNTALSGETIDYGPCAFMDAYDPATVFSSVDRMGRYAYGNQPGIAQWNLARLAEAMLPLLAEHTDAALEIAQDVLAAFAARFEGAFHDGLARKLGFAERHDNDAALAGGVLTALAANRVDFTLFFRRLSDATASGVSDEPLRALFMDPAECDALLERWRRRLSEQATTDDQRRAAMRAVNPAYIPRNHRIETIIVAAVEGGNYAPFEELLQVLSRPFDDQPGYVRYAEPPQSHERVLATFCGT